MENQLFPIIKQGLTSNNYEVQQESLQAVGWIGEPAIPLLEDFINEASTHPEDLKLQKEAVEVLGWIGEPALSTLKKLSKNQSLDSHLRKKIKDWIKQL